MWLPILKWRVSILTRTFSHKKIWNVNMTIYGIIHNYFTKIKVWRCIFVKLRIAWKRIYSGCLKALRDMMRGSTNLRSSLFGAILAFCERAIAVTLEVQPLPGGVHRNRCLYSEETQLVSTELGEALSFRRSAHRSHNVSIWTTNEKTIFFAFHEQFNISISFHPHLNYIITDSHMN